MSRSMHVLGFFLAGFLATTALCATDVPAAEPKPPVDQAKQNEAVKALIAKLNADNYLDREEAERELLKLGQQSLPLLKEATNSTQPEIAARAKQLVDKLAQNDGKPMASYDEIFPDTSIFFLEARDAKATLDRLKTGPLGKLWDLPQFQTFYKGHYDDQVPNDQKVLDSLQELLKIVEGRALFALGAPETIDAAELDPPFVHVLESKQPQALESQIRALFQGMADPLRTSRRYGAFMIEEQISAQTAFTQDGMIHCLTMPGIEATLDAFAKHPASSLTKKLTSIRSMMPQADAILHLSRTGFKELSDSAKLVDDELIRRLDSLGLVDDSVLQGAAAVNADGFEERMRLSLGGGAKNEGLLAVLNSMSIAATDENKPRALDLIPWQAAILMSFQGDFAKSSNEMAKALRVFDRSFLPETPEPAVKPEPAPKAEQKGVDIKKTTGNTLGREAIAEGAKDKDHKASLLGAPPKPEKDKAPQKAAAPAPPPAPAVAPAPAPAPVAPAPAPGPEPAKAPDAPVLAAPKADDAKPGVDAICPHLKELESILKLEQIFAQVDGPIQCALFPHAIADKAPEQLPISMLLAASLKEPKIIEQALDAQATGAEPRFKKEALNGGTLYVEDSAGEQHRSVWLKDNYLAFSDDKDVLDLASKAVLHAAGNERMADRPSYKQALADKRLDPQAVLSVYGDADQVLEMPYKLATFEWPAEQKNPYPDYAVIRPLLLNKLISIQLTSSPDGLKLQAQTPLTVIGMIVAFLRPIQEGNF